MESVHNKRRRKPHWMQNVASVLLHAIILLLFSVRLFAQNFGVNTNGDTHAVSPSTSALDANGNISLRSALEAATAMSGSHIITFGSIGSSINLTLGQITVGNASLGNNITISGPGMNSLSVNQTTDNRIFSTGTGAVTFVLQDVTLHFAGPGITPYSGGGGAIVAGGSGASTTLTNVTFSNFNLQIGNGGAVSQSSSLNSHNLTVTNCVFTSNKCGGAGGAISYNGLGTVLIAGCTFTNNHTGVVGANTGGDGGAVSTTGGGNGGTYTIEKNNFLNNQVENTTGHGGAIINTNGALTARYNRFIGNGTANTSNPPLANVIAQTGGATINTTNADNNWWGVNTGPGTNDATALAAGGTMTLVKWLQMRHTANPASVNVNPPGSTTLTASFLINSADEAISASNLTALVGLPITFNNAVKGVISSPQSTIQSGGTATATYTVNANACPPSGSADAKVDNATATATITIVDNVPPVIDQCQPNISNVSTSTGHCYAPVSFSIQAHDNCTFDITFTASGATTGAVTSGSNFNKGTTTVVATVTDAGNNTATCSFTITVVDKEAPVISNCSQNITVNTGAGNTQCSQTATWTEPTANDNCDGALTYTTRSAAPGSTFPVGNTTVTYTFQDDATNTSTCNFTVTVVDNTPPVISNCPANITVYTGDENVQCSQTATWTAPTASDNCGGTTLQSNYSPGATFNQGATTVTYSATDTHNNTSTCGFTVTVIDNTPPVITCPANITVSENPAGSGSAAVNFTVTATDNCSATTVATKEGANTVTSGGIFTVGVHTIDATANDASSNTSSCSFTITVVPACQITCPPNVTVNAAPDQCSATATWDAPTTTGDCGTLTLDHHSGDVFPVGTTTVTVSSQSTGQSCHFDVIVYDKQAPTITCPANATLALGTGACKAPLPNYTTEATVTDNCTPSANITITQSPAPDEIEHGVGPLTVTLTATDASGNTSTCQFTVNKVDVTKPDITCPGTQTLNVGANCTVSLPDYTGLATASDGCSTPSVTQSPSPGATESPGSITVTLTATDASSNTQTCSFTVNVVDNMPPVITCADNVTVNTDLDQCYATNVNLGTTNATDNCGSTTVQGVRSDAQALSASYPKGVTTIHWTATDGSGKTATCDQTVTVYDEQAPTITCPADATVELNDNCLIHLQDYTTNATVSDNCTPTANITVTQSPEPDQPSFGTGPQTITLTAHDASGNTSTCHFTITKVDKTPPHLECPGTQTLVLGANCTASLPNYAPLAIAGDECSTVTLTQSPPANTVVSGTGPVIVTLTATDASNNTRTCSFTVNKADNTPPTITCAANTTVNTDANLCYATLDPTPPPSSDNCGGTTVNGVRSDAQPLNGTYPKGTTTIKWTATDGSGHTATCNQDVIVQDMQPPSISCPPDVTVNAPLGQCTAVVSSATIGQATATDNCTPSASITISHTGFPAGNVFNVGTTNIVWTATDGSSNGSTCSQKVIVEDITPPTITNVSVTPATLWPPNHTMRDVTVNYTSTDLCGATVNCTLSVASNQPINGTADGDTSPDWIVVDDHHVKLRAERANNSDDRIYTITITCADASGNSTSQSVNVVVAHNITAPGSGKPFIVGSTVNFAGVFWDKPGNKHTAQWLIDDNTTTKASVTEPSGNKNGSVTGSYKFTTTGIYRLQMNVTDQNKVTSYVNTNDDLEEIVVIYDPNGGYAYGGGWFNSPSGALTADQTARGKVSYGFSVNYYKGATLPKGETQFEFKLGSLQYNALNFDYLSISGYKAVFAGSGKILAGQSGINFTMYVIDGALDGTGIDKVRIKIYNKNTGYIYYDNEPGSSDAADPKTPVGLNSTVIITGTPPLTGQKAITNAEVISLPANLQIRAIPNPSNTDFRITVKSNNQKDKILMQVVDIYGRIVEVRYVMAAQTIQLGDKYRPGTYMVRFIQGQQQEQLKLIKMSN